MIQTTYGDGTVTRSAYDSQNRLEWSTDRYDPTSGLLPNGTHTIYDGLGRVVRTEQVAQVNIALEVDTDIPGNDTIQRSYRAASGAVLSWTQSVYDDHGRVIQTIQSDGRTSETLCEHKGGQNTKGVRFTYRGGDEISSGCCAMARRPRNDLGGVTYQDVTSHIPLTPIWSCGRSSPAHGPSRLGPRRGAAIRGGCSTR